MPRTNVRVTRADVAKAANVTETIVSYVVNNNRYVAEHKKLRVQEAIDKLGYRPNTMARALKGKKTNHILFIVDDMQSEHFGSIISEIDKRATDKGYFFTLCYDRGDDDFFRRISDGYFDALVIGSAKFSPNKIQALINKKIPVVLFEICDFGTFDGLYAKVNTGLFEGARQCVSALYDKGRKNIAFVGGSWDENISTEVDFLDLRYKGYVKQMQELNLDFIQEHVIFGYKNEESLRERIAAILKSTNKPDAFMCRTDYIAYYVMDVIKEVGLEVPKDISVIGFNNSALCSLSYPSLSSVKIDRKLAGETVLDFLEKLLHDEHDAVLESVLNTTLIMRDSA